MPDAMPQPPTADPPATPPPPLPDLTGRTLGDYQILRRLGTGGMGQVYLARQMSLKREVALKLVARRYGYELDRAGSASRPRPRRSPN